MGARLAHASATPTSLDLQLHELTEIELVPMTQHKTPTGTVIGRYIHGVRARRAQLTLMLRTTDEYNNFVSFYRTTQNANTRFTFTPDITNFPSDTRSAYFVSDPQFTRWRHGAKVAGAVSVVIEDAPVSL